MLSVPLIRNIDYVITAPLGFQLFNAFQINLYILGVFAFAGFALPTQDLLPKSYYNITQSQQLKRWYNRLGIDQFRRVLLATLWKDENRRKNYFDGTQSGIAHFATESRKAEFGHLIPLILITLISVYILYRGAYVFALATMFLNIVANLYPVILQRYHRTRIMAIYKRKNRNS